jgi:hypothetical protein
MSWHRVRGTAPNEQTYESEPYRTEIVQPDADVAADRQLKHAQEQLALSKQYPGRTPRPRLVR